MNRCDREGLLMLLMERRGLQSTGVPGRGLPLFVDGASGALIKKREGQGGGCCCCFWSCSC